jgi:hypothetical protein
VTGSFGSQTGPGTSSKDCRKSSGTPPTRRSFTCSKSQSLRLLVPPPPGQWEVRFGTSAAAAGWEELCRHALLNTRRCLETLRTDPRSGTGHDRQHRLRGDLATHRHNGRDLEQ